MSGLMDFLDDYIIGPLNWIDRLDGLISGVKYKDLGYQVSILYHDRGGNHSRAEIEEILTRYGIDTFGHTHDSKHMHFRVKHRQARWAEYILLHAGAKIMSPTYDQRNPNYLAQHEPGWMPKPWSNQDR